MNEPARRPSAFRLIASAVFLALVIGGLWLQARPPQAPVLEPTTPAGPPTDEPVELPPPALGREALLDAVAAASDAYASGKPADPGLVGRSFEISFVFGCGGPALAGSTAPQRWEYDAEAQALKVSALPVDFSAMPWIEAMAGDTPLEAAEGFWVERPWQRAAACPGGAPSIEAGVSLALPRETLAIAELFPAGAPRSRQRNKRAYEIVRKATPEQVAELRGFRLVVEGRLAALPNGGAIGCWAPSPDIRPTCLVAASFEQIRIEELGTATPLAEWRP